MGREEPSPKLSAIAVVTKGKLNPNVTSRCHNVLQESQIMAHDRAVTTACVRALNHESGLKMTDNEC